MIRSVERLKYIHDDEYITGTKVLSLPVPYINDDLYMVTGDDVYVHGIQYIRIVDVDATGIYEWYLYIKNGVYKVLWGLHHTKVNVPSIVYNRNGINEFINDYSVRNNEDDIFPLHTRHVINQYLSTIIGEIYGSIWEDSEFGSDPDSKHRLEMVNGVSISEVVSEFTHVSDSFNQIMNWFDRTNMYDFTHVKINTLLNVCSNIARNTCCDKLTGLVNKLNSILPPTIHPSEDTRSLWRNLSDGYIEPREIRKVVNLEDAALSRMNIVYDSRALTKQHIVNNDTQMPRDVIKIVAACPVRELKLDIDEYGRITDIKINDLYGYSGVILRKYIDLLVVKIYRLFKGLKIQVYKTWDNYLIVIPNDGYVGIESINLTTAVVSHSEFVHLS